MKERIQQALGLVITGIVTAAGYLWIFAIPILALLALLFGIFHIFFPAPDPYPLDY